MSEQELAKRVDELERRVRDLEARPVYVPVPYYPPYAPLPEYPVPYRNPWEPPWFVTCTASTSTAGQ